MPTGTPFSRLPVPTMPWDKEGAFHTPSCFHRAWWLGSLVGHVMKKCTYSTLRSNSRFLVLRDSTAQKEPNQCTSPPSRNLQSLGLAMDDECLLSPALSNKPHDSEVGGQQTGCDLRGNLKCITLMFVKYYAGCIYINHSVLIFPGAAPSLGVTFFLCVCPLSAGLLAPFLPISIVSIFHPSVQQALIKHLVYILFIFVGPEPGHCILVAGKGLCYSRSNLTTFAVSSPALRNITSVSSFNPATLTFCSPHTLARGREHRHASWSQLKGARRVTEVSS